MKIAHIAIWTEHLEKMREFYITYFNGKSNRKYTNPAKGFESYFIYFDGETSIELMRSQHIKENAGTEKLGICHLAFSLENKEKVCELTERLRKDGYIVAGEPRTTGDGFFESVVLDVESNRIELVAEKP